MLDAFNIKIDVDDPLNDDIIKEYLFLNKKYYFTDELCTKEQEIRPLTDQYESF